MSTQDSPGNTDPLALTKLGAKINGIPEAKDDCPQAEPQRKRLAGKVLQYAKMPHDITRQMAKMGLAAYGVYGALAMHAMGTNHVFPSQERLAEITGLGVRAVRKALTRLCKMGIIRHGPKHGRVNSYFVTIGGQQPEQ